MEFAHRAARGKRTVAGVARFLDRLEPEVLALQRDLGDGRYVPGQAFRFEIRDPKTRTISAAPFRDRVVHHALIDPLEPLFDRRMIFESFACRKEAREPTRHCVTPDGSCGDTTSFLLSEIGCPEVLRFDRTRCRHGHTPSHLKDRRVLDLCGRSFERAKEPTFGIATPSP